MLVFPWSNEIYLVLLPEIAETVKYFEVQDKQQANLQVVLNLTTTFSMRSLLLSYVAKHCLWYSFWEQRNSSNVSIGSRKACTYLQHYKAFFVGFQGFIGLSPQYTQKSQPLTTRGEKESKENNGKIIMTWHHSLDLSQSHISDFPTNFACTFLDTQTACFKALSENSVALMSAEQIHWKHA